MNENTTTPEITEKIPVVFANGELFQWIENLSEMREIVDKFRHDGWVGAYWKLSSGDWGEGYKNLVVVHFPSHRVHFYR